MPVGLQLIGNYLAEGKLLNAATASSRPPTSTSAQAGGHLT
jgi:Asp-tRNA(Asn)/Glu-tRNA(Gln) amidotransferase A subunit family amidase